MENTLRIEAPIFVLFAEYLGYCSRFLEDCEKWCKGEIPSIYIQRIVKVEAKSILRQMKKDYSVEDIVKWYKTYEEPLLKDYKDGLESILDEKEAMEISGDELC